LPIRSGCKASSFAQGDTYEEAMANIRSAVAFHVETFGEEVLEGRDDILEAFVAEASLGTE
jgi:predicted RNase H-like HicB family nuclease